LFDPLSVPSEIEELEADRDPVVVLTCPWHERDTQSLVERLGAPVFVPPPDEGTPDVAWLLGGDTAEGHLFSAGDRLPVAKAAVRSLPATRLSTSATPRDPVRVAPRGHDPRSGRRGLRPLLALPVEHVLATHGGPSDRAALERALS
jgi:hypothetical protein